MEEKLSPEREFRAKEIGKRTPKDSDEQIEPIKAPSLSPSEEITSTSSENSAISDEIAPDDETKAQPTVSAGGAPPPND